MVCHQPTTGGYDQIVAAFESLENFDLHFPKCLLAIVLEDGWDILAAGLFDHMICIDKFEAKLMRQSLTNDSLAGSHETDQRYFVKAGRRLIHPGIIPFTTSPCTDQSGWPVN